MKLALDFTTRPVHGQSCPCRIRSLRTHARVRQNRCRTLVVAEASAQDRLAEVHCGTIEPCAFWGSVERNPTRAQHAGQRQLEIGERQAAATRARRRLSSGMQMMPVTLM